MKVSAVTSKICFRSNFTHFYNYMYGNCFTFNGATNNSLITTRTGPLYGRTAADSRRALHTHALTHSRTHARTYVRTSKHINAYAMYAQTYRRLYTHTRKNLQTARTYARIYTRAHAPPLNDIRISFRDVGLIDRAFNIHFSLCTHIRIQIII